MTKTLYLDLDGVCADWTTGVQQLIGYKLQDPKQHYPDHDWQKIKTADRLFKTLPKMPLADNFVNLARQFRDTLHYELLFLTAIPTYNDMPWAFYDKMTWTQSYYPDIPVHFGPYAQDKQKYSKPNNILVDDRLDNCTQWESKGGIAIHVPYNNEIIGLNNLQQLFNNKQSLNNLKHMT